MALNIRFEDSNLTLKVENIKRAAESGRMSGLNAVGKAVVEAEKDAMLKQIDRPTPYTLRSVRQSLVLNKQAVKVFVMDRQADYLKYMTLGMDDRKVKVVPLQRAKNKYGNLPKGATKRGKVFTFKRKGETFFARRTGKSRNSINVFAKIRRFRKGGNAFTFTENAQAEVRRSGKQLMRKALIEKILKYAK